MRRLLSLVSALCVAIIVSSSSLGSLTEEKKAAVPKHFEALAFLVGSSWVGTFPDGKTTDVHTFEWVYGKKFIRDTHVVRGTSSKTYEGETIYAFDAEKKQVVFWYIANSGGFSQGSVAVDGKKINFDEKFTGKKTQQMKSVWEKVSKDAYDAHTYAVQGDKLKKLFTIRFERQKSSK
jgi:hypothetical protein